MNLGQRNTQATELWGALIDLKVAREREKG